MYHPDYNLGAIQLALADTSHYKSVMPGVTGPVQINRQNGKRTEWPNLQ